MRPVLAVLPVVVALASAASVVDTLASPALSISGLAFGQDLLWALDTDEQTVFVIDPTSGGIVNTLSLSYITGYECYGLAISNDTLFVAWLKYGGPDSYFMMHDAWTGALIDIIDLC
ncbi:hypothetical protein JW921_08320 [Candidatus Fermentibacterales bacterium]|nr:hypothetical protein [Candidatus Fermentibacterales bacterium]